MAKGLPREFMSERSVVAAFPFAAGEDVYAILAY